MSDPYFQPLFADRIGGAELRQGHRDLQVREDQAGQAEGPGRAPRAEAGRLRHRRKRRDGRPAACATRHGARSTSPRTAATPTTASPPSRRPPPGSCSASSASTLDPATEINHCIGSKTALAMLPAAFINPGDVTLMTVPGYPVAGTHTALLRRRGPSPAAARRERLLPRPGLRSRPTSAAGPSCWCSTIPTARPGRWPRASSIAASSTLPTPTEIVVVQDAAHVMLSYDGPPLSFLAGRGRPRGGRRGPLDVQGLQHDRLADGLGLRPCADRAGLCRREGQLRLGPVHRHPEGGGGGAATIHEIADGVREKYRRRLQKLVAALAQGRLRLPKMPGGTYFLYAPAPRAATGRPSPTPKRRRSS